MSAPQHTPTYTVPQYASMLRDVLSTTDKDQRCAVENRIVQSYRDPDTAVTIAELIASRHGSPDNDNVRQLAAILLRRRVVSMWPRLSLQQQTRLKELLLTELTANQQTQNDPLFRAVAQVVCAIGRVEIPSHWNELMVCIETLSQASEPDVRRCAALLMVQNLADVLLLPDSPYIERTWAVTTAGLSDPHAVVVRAALKAVRAAASLAGTAQQSMLRSAAPTLLTIMATIVHGQAGGVDADEAELLHWNGVLEAVEAVLDVAKPADTDALVSALMSICGNKGTHLQLRENAGSILETFVKSRSKAVVKRGLLQPLFDLSFQLLSEGEAIYREQTTSPTPDDSGAVPTVAEAVLSEAVPPSTIGHTLLTAMAEKLPSKRVQAMLQQRVVAVSSSGADAYAKKAVVLAIGACCSGCAEAMRPQVSALLHIVGTMIQDAAPPFVRKAAVLATSQMCEFLQPEILDEHAVLVPLLHAQLRDHDDVCAEVSHTLAVLCENLRDEIEPYIDTLVPTLVAALHSSSLLAQQHVCGALASIARAKTESPSPALKQHAAPLLELLQSAVAEPAPIRLRGRALSLVGPVAVACPALFQPHFGYFWPQFVAALQSDYPELRTDAFSFYADIVELFDSDFVPPSFQTGDLCAVMDIALRTLSDHNAIVQVATEGGSDDDDLCPLGAEDRDSEDVADPGRCPTRTFVVKTAKLEELSAAIGCAAAAARNAKSHFAPFQEQFESTIGDIALHFFHTGVRVDAIAAGPDLLIARQAAAETCDGGGKAFQRASNGELPSIDPFGGTTRAAITSLVEGQLFVVCQDENTEIVSTACDALFELVKTFGAAVLMPYLQDVIDVVVSHLTRARNSAGDSGDDQDEAAGFGQDDEHHEDHLDSVVDVVTSIAESAGPAFAPYFNTVVPLLVLFCGEDRCVEDHIMATATLASCGVLKGAASGCYDACAAAALDVLRHTESAVARANACFIICQLAASVPSRITPQQGHVFLTALEAVLSNTHEENGTRDNAVTAVCSLISNCAQDTVPLPQALPLILSYLPMKKDFDENERAARCLAHVAERHVGALLASPGGQLFNDFVKCSGCFLATSTVARDVKLSLTGVLHQHLVTSHNVEFMKATENLPRRYVKAFSTFLPC